MAGGIGGAGSAAGGFYAAAAAASETDGETFDNDTDFDDYDEWDYAEIVATVTKNMKTYVLQPIVVGASAAFGMSVGYAIFDATASLFSSRKATARSS